jgi:hypothetical protein
MYGRKGRTLTQHSSATSQWLQESAGYRRLSDGAFRTYVRSMQSA